MTKTPTVITGFDPAKPGSDKSESVIIGHSGGVILFDDIADDDDNGTYSPFGDFMTDDSPSDMGDAAAYALRMLEVKP